MLSSDNNYTNGFMTQTTMIALCVATIVPKKFITDSYRLSKEFLENKYEKSKLSSLYSIKNFYKSKPKMYDLLINNGKKIIDEQNRPCLVVPYYNKKNNKIDNIKIGEPIGTRGFFQLFMPKKLIELKFDINQADLDLFSLWWLSTKYKQYANQRNTD
jgi:hypothetical protein